VVIGTYAWSSGFELSGRAHHLEDAYDPEGYGLDPDVAADRVASGKEVLRGDAAEHGHVRGRPGRRRR